MKSNVGSPVFLGKDCKIDKLAFVGLRPLRKIPDLKTTVGDGAVCMRNSIIYLGSTIGKNLLIGHNAIIREQNIIGDDFKLWNNSIVDYGCHIGNKVKIHSQVYVAQFTNIEDDAFLAPGVIIGNDPHPGCAFSTKCMRGPTIRKGAKIGINVTILPFITIGEYSLIGAGSVVTKDIPSNSVAYGNPARVVKSIYELKCLTGLTDKPYNKKKR